MTQSEFLKRWLMHYVHPEYFYIPWSDNRVGTVTLNLTLTGNPIQEMLDFMCSFYIYHVETDEYMEFTKYGDWYVGKPMRISGESGDVVTISPSMTDMSGEIILRLPFGTYQYIEYECVYGKIKKQPIQFTVDRTDRTVTIAHPAAYLHTWVGEEEIVDCEQYVVSEREYKYEDALFPLPAGREAYFRPYNAGYEFLTGSSDNSDRQGFNFGQAYLTPSGHYTRRIQHHYWHQEFETTMDWNVTAHTQMLYESPWSDKEVITYGKVDFDVKDEQNPYGFNSEGYWSTGPVFARGSDVIVWTNKTVDRNMSYWWQDCILPHPIMEYYVNDWKDPFTQELNGMYVLNFRDDTFNRDAHWIYNAYFHSILNVNVITCNDHRWYVYNGIPDNYNGYYYFTFDRAHNIISGKQGEKYYEVLDEDTGVITHYEEKYTPQEESWVDRFVYQFTYDESPYYYSGNPLLIVNSNYMVEVKAGGEWLR